MKTVTLSRVEFVMLIATIFFLIGVSLYAGRKHDNVVRQFQTYVLTNSIHRP